MMRKTDNATMADAMRLLAASIKSDLASIALEMLAMLPHRTAMPEGCPTCAIKARLAEMGIEA